MSYSTLPLELYAGKKYFRKQLLTFAGLIVFAVVCFYYGSGKLFTEDYYYPKVTFIMPVLVVVSIGAIIAEAIRYYSKKPVVVLDQTGITFKRSPYNALGCIRWQNVTHFQEMAEGSQGRKFAFFVDNPDTYISNISNYFKRRSIRKQCKDRNDALAELNTAMFDANPAELKQLINDILSNK